jgi:hypothetical protein
VADAARSPADAAPAYVAELGWPVLPLWWAEDGRCACGRPDCAKPGKHPIGAVAPKGVHSATTDAAVIRWWRRRYPRHNLGVACAGLWILDPNGRPASTRSPISRTATTGSRCALRASPDAAACTCCSPATRG